MEWQKAEEIQEKIEKIIAVLSLTHINPKRIFCYRTIGSVSRSYARIWSFPKIFQTALKMQPAYVIEVLSKYFDRLEEEDKEKVLIHELLHIPKNFSGALLPHRSRGRRLEKSAEMLFKQYKMIIKKK